jgi:hypothetical protein
MRAELICGGKPNDSILHSCQDDAIIMDSEQPNIIFYDKNPKRPLIKPENKTPKPPHINPEDLIGRTVLLDEQKDGQKFRARIVKLIEHKSSDLNDNKIRMKFLRSKNDNDSEEIITYNQLLEQLSKSEENDIEWKFHRIASHQGQLKPGHADYKGSTYNVMIEWENGLITSEQLKLIAKMILSLAQFMQNNMVYCILHNGSSSGVLPSERKSSPG